MADAMGSGFGFGALGRGVALAALIGAVGVQTLPGRALAQSTTPGAADLPQNL